MRFNGLTRLSLICLGILAALGRASLPHRSGVKAGTTASSGPVAFPVSPILVAATSEEVTGPNVATTDADRGTGDAEPPPDSPKTAPPPDDTKPIPWPGASVVKLRPVKSGPGILVCEPIAAHADKSLADLGAGSSRWLQLTVGGDGRMGATPLWTAADRARREMGRKDLRLILADAGSLRHTLGITHVTLGSVTGSAKRGTLTYRLYSLPGLKAVGKPVALSGSEEQIAAGLPSAARQLGTALGAGALRVPDGTGLAAPDLEFLGRLPWLPDPGLSAEAQRRLESLAPRSALAGFLLLCAGWRDDVKGVAPTVRDLLRQLPENALALGEIGYKVGFTDALPEARAQLDLCRRRYPMNYLLAHCEVWRQRATDGDPDREYRAAEQTVQRAYENPEAWLSLGETIYQATERVRKSRVIAKLSRREMDFLDRAYLEWLTAVYRAAKLDPRYGKAWLRVATAATFAGAVDLADAAFWKAVRHDWEDRTDVWYWGMQMYQPKWGGDPKKLEKVARMAMEECRYDHRTVFVLTALHEAENKRLAEELSQKVLDTLHETVRRSPDDVPAHTGLAWVYDTRAQEDESIREFWTVTRLAPDDADAHFRLARILYHAGQRDESIREYREVVRLNPKYAPARKELAWVEEHPEGGAGEGKPSGAETH